MHTRNLYRISKYDFVVSAIILVFSFSCVLSFNKSGADSKKEALVYENNGLVETIDLSSSGTKDFNFKNNKIVIEAKDGKIAVTRSDCPRNICKHTGRISNSGQTIVCVPNKILVEIVEASPAVACDAVSY